MPDICGSTDTSSGEPCQNPAGSCPHHDQEEVCGAETNSGDPCQHPAGSCPVHQEQSDEPGRPSKFTEEMRQQILDEIKRCIAEDTVPTKKLLARSVGIHPDTLSGWLEKGREDMERGENTQFFQFFRSVARARVPDERKQLKRLASRNPSWVLSQVYGYNPTTKRLEHTGPGGGPIATMDLPSAADIMGDEEMEEHVRALAEKQVEMDEHE